MMSCICKKFVWLLLKYFANSFPEIKQLKLLNNS